MKWKLMMGVMAIVIVGGMVTAVFSSSIFGGEYESNSDEYGRAQLAGAQWPMFQMNSNHTGLTPYDTSSNTGSEEWNFTDYMPMATNPVIGADGSIYIGMDKFYALNPDGTEKWNVSLTISEEVSPAIGTDGTIYVNTDVGLVAVNPDGTQKWYSQAGGGSSSPAVLDNGTIYVGGDDGNISAVDLDGNIIWNFTAMDLDNVPSMIESSPTVGPDGTIYFGANNGVFYALYPNGTQKWNYTTNDSIRSTAAVGSDGTIYFGSDNKIFYALYPNGTQKWNFSANDMIESGAAIASEGTIYFCSFSTLYALNSDGTEKWHYNGTQISFGSFSPAIGADGRIYVVAMYYGEYSGLLVLGNNAVPEFSDALPIFTLFMVGVSALIIRRKH